MTGKRVMVVGDIDRNPRLNVMCEALAEKGYIVTHVAEDVGFNGMDFDYIFMDECKRLNDEIVEKFVSLCPEVVVPDVIVKGGGVRGTREYWQRGRR
jgi:hypothetical protein